MPLLMVRFGKGFGGFYSVGKRRHSLLNLDTPLPYAADVVRRWSEGA